MKWGYGDIAGGVRRCNGEAVIDAVEKDVVCHNFLPRRESDAAWIIYNVSGCIFSSG